MAGGGSNDEAEKAREAEEKRQKAIREGTARINSIFDGGTTVTDKVGADAEYDPDATYYNSDGSVWQPDPSDLGLGSSWTLHSNKPLFESARREGLYSGVETKGGFDDEFFADRRQSYIDFARPQVDREFADAKEQLIYSLARGGTSGSSVAGEKNADLQRDYDTEIQNITDRGREYETQARTAVEDARANLIATLNATGDAQGAANAALARSSALSQTPAYSPVGQLFGDFSGGLAQQAALERAEAASGRDYARYNTGWFGAKPGAVKTT